MLGKLSLIAPTPEGPHVHQYKNWRQSRLCSFLGLCHERDICWMTIKSDFLMVYKILQYLTVVLFNQELYFLLLNYFLILKILFIGSEALHFDPPLKSLTETRLWCWNIIPEAAYRTCTFIQIFSTSGEARAQENIDFRNISTEIVRVFTETSKIVYLLFPETRQPKKVKTSGAWKIEVQVKFYMF